MKMTIRKTLLMAACLAAVAGCDAKPAEPVAAAPVAAPAPAAPPPPLTTAEIVAKLDNKAACKLFELAVSTVKKKIEVNVCAATAGEADVALATTDGAVTLTAPVVHDGSVVQVAAPIASAAAVENKTQGGWDNIGMVFVGEAPPAKDLCLSIDYFAPNGGANSLFVATQGAAAAPWSLASHETDWLKAQFPTPVLKAGT